MAWLSRHAQMLRACRARGHSKSASKPRQRASASASPPVAQNLPYVAIAQLAPVSPFVAFEPSVNSQNLRQSWLAAQQVKVVAWGLRLPLRAENSTGCKGLVCQSGQRIGLHYFKKSRSKHDKQVQSGCEACRLQICGHVCGGSRGMARV